MTKKIQIFDLDNCISNDGWRIAKIDMSLQGESRWDLYHELCDRDEAHNLDAIDAMPEDSPIVIFTARPEKFRAKTERWIENYARLSDRVMLMYMRGENDDRSAVEIKKSFLIDLAEMHGIYPEHVLIAYDDREDVIEMYKMHGVNAAILKIHDINIPTDHVSGQIHLMEIATVENIQSGARAPDEILEEMAETYRMKNAVYGSNYEKVCVVMKILFPEGVSKELLWSEEFALFRNLLTKLTRFTNSGLTHVDSIHDMAVYSAMIESVLTTKQENGNG